MKVEIPDEVYVLLVEALDAACKARDLLPYMNEMEAEFGFQNVVVWADPFGQASLTLIRRMQ